MNLKDEINYRSFLLKRAIKMPRYHIPAGIGVASSFLISLVDPLYPGNGALLLLGLTATGTGMYLGLEPAVLRFPTKFRFRFRGWFERYSHLQRLTPPESGIDLQNSPISPAFLLSQLQKMTRENLDEAQFTHFVQEIEVAFTQTERKVTEAKNAINDIKRRQISQEIQEETRRVAASVENYTQTLQSVYSIPNPDQKLKAEEELQSLIHKSDEN